MSELCGYIVNLEIIKKFFVIIRICNYVSMYNISGINRFVLVYYKIDAETLKVFSCSKY